MTDVTKPYNERPVLGRFTQQVAEKGGYLGGLKESVKLGAEDIKKGVNVFSDASKGHRVVAFGRIAGVGAGLAYAAGALRSQTADGEDRSALARLGQLVLGGGIAAGSLIAGKGR